MSRTRKLHDAFDWYNDDDDEDDMGDADLIHEIVDLTLPDAHGDVFVEFDALLQGAEPGATAIVVPIVLAERVVAALLLRPEAEDEEEA